MNCWDKVWKSHFSAAALAYLECGACGRRFGPFPAAINARVAHPRTHRERLKAVPEVTAAAAYLECGACGRRFGPLSPAINARVANPRPHRERVKAVPEGTALQKLIVARAYPLRLPIWSAAPAGAAFPHSPQRSTPAQPIPASIVGERKGRPRLSAAAFAYLECGACGRRFTPFPAAI
ncbi:MAG: hypothetical protein ACKO38_21800, partial [Planctomycetota bacterium]